MSRKHPLSNSFGFALEGLRSCLKEEPNFRIHIFFTLATIALGYYLNISISEWVLLVVVIAMVFVTELINTAIEAMINVLSPEKQPSAKVTKDIAASAVLVSAIASLIVGALIFLPKL